MVASQYKHMNLHSVMIITLFILFSAVGLRELCCNSLGILIEDDILELFMIRNNGK